LSRTGLAFHSEHLNAGGACKVTYSALGSLKNHGPGTAAGIEISHQIVSGALWVERVEITPSNWSELGTSKPARFTVYVHTNEAWPSAGKDAVIVVRLHADGEASAGEGAKATFTVRNQCEPKQSDKSDKPDKPDQPNKPAKPDKSQNSPKRKKSSYDPRVNAPRPGEAVSIPSQGEV